MKSMKKVIFTAIATFALIGSPVQAKAGSTEEAITAAVTTTAGVAAGYGIVTATGMTAAGMMGGGAGVGAAAGPVGAAVGGLFGLAAYGIYKIFD